MSEDPTRDGLNWYAYCNGNPMAFVDPSGMAPTAEEGAVIAKHVYNDPDDPVKLIGGWEHVKDYSPMLVNLKIGVYQRKKADGSIEYVLANKGTDGIGDAIEDVEQYMGTSTVVENSIAYAKAFIAEHPNSEVSFVGHSKGGLEAAANAIATNKNAYLYNPMMLNYSRYFLGFALNIYTAEMKSYVVEGEILNKLFGDIIDREDKFEHIPLPTQYNIDTGGIFDNINNMINNHSINSVINAIRMKNLCM